MRSSVNSLLPIRNAITLTAGHRRVGQARRWNFDFKSAGPVAFFNEGKDSIRTGSDVTFVGRFAGVHCSALQQTSR